MTMLEPGIVCTRRDDGPRRYDVWHGDHYIGSVYPSPIAGWFADMDGLGNIATPPHQTRRAAIAQLALVAGVAA